MIQTIIPNRVIIHCSASKNGEYYGADQIDSDHRGRGFDQIGYHIILQPDGSVERGRGLNDKGAHCIEANGDSTGICLIGTDKFTRAQFRSLRYQLDGLMITYPMRKWDLYCHYQFESARQQHKSCPNIKNNDLLAWYLLEDNKAIMPYILED